MVTRCRAEAGLGLVEVVIALALLAVGALGAAGTLAWANAHLRAAEADEALLSAAESTLDSLLALRAPAGGSSQVAGGTLTWQVRAADRVLAVEMQVRGDPHASTFALTLHAARADPPPVLAVGQ